MSAVTLEEQAAEIRQVEANLAEHFRQILPALQQVHESLRDLSESASAWLKTPDGRPFAAVFLRLEQRANKRSRRAAMFAKRFAAVRAA